MGFQQQFREAWKAQPLFWLFRHGRAVLGVRKSS